MDSKGNQSQKKEKAIVTKITKTKTYLCRCLRKPLIIDERIYAEFQPSEHPHGDYDKIILKCLL